MSMKVWLQEFRAPFLIAVILPTTLGGIVAAARLSSGFHIPYFLLTLLGAVFIHIGANVANDYFDFKSGADVYLTPEEKTPFSGGSGMLADGSIKPRKALAVAFLFLMMGSLIGFYFVYMLGSEGYVLLIVGILGVFSALFYTAPPFKLGYRGVGEVFLGLAFGPLVVFGTYFVQTAAFAWEPIVASIPMGLLITNILYINQFPDYRPDKKAGKMHIVARLGKDKAIKGYLILMVAIYTSIIVGVILGLLDIIESIPLWSLITLATVPLSVKTIKYANQHFNEPQALIPANAATIKIFVLIAILMCFSYLPRFFGVML